jgi:curved DNA-binding protein CbpA
MNDTRPDPYAVLGVPPTATAQQINRAYRRLVRRRHPDTRSGGAALADGSSGPVSLADLLTAYDVLRDPVTRAEHDRTRAAAPEPEVPPRGSPRRGPSTVGREEVDPAVRVGDQRPGRQRVAREPDIRVGPVMWRPRGG